eukprot:Gregarina_sp_Poly_1__944@NODE_1228_length_4718_cov_193_100624_g836_i0_p1_GENE_NODE_1228_length_4718_cov_193_100624_g836_i0NODE_1228_length_4718_cov_193_100624_g836_i0_p1_ORF_typecomplete_len616_score69_79Sel1/PF08238_12/1_3e04Sel1/PF08238_12/0_00074Sel1/PF08238_12/6_NODE_1228_length_4718_cov_193_100624_g836_i022074054
MKTFPHVVSLNFVVAACAGGEALKLCHDVFSHVLKNETSHFDLSSLGTEGQFTYAAVLPFCRDFLSLGSKVTSEFADDVQLVLEYFSSQSLKPAALAAMARRVSAFHAACPVGIKYLEPASLGIAMDNHLKPKSLIMKPPPTSAMGKVPHDPAALSWNHLSDMASDLAGTHDYNLMQAAAHRYLMGGERFPQNYKFARQLLEQVSLNTGKAESLAMLSVMYYLGLGVEADKTTALRLLHLAAHNLKSSSAHSHLAVGIMDFLGSPSGRLVVESGHDAIKDLLGIALEKESPMAAFNLVAYELLSNAPIKVKWLLTLSAAVARGSPVATHTLARLTSNDLIGIQTCSQAWSLMARVIRDDLWSSTAILALENLGSKTHLSEIELMKLAVAGVEQAEWSLSQLADIEPLWEPRIRLLSFSAHLGRAAAQLKLAGASHQVNRHLPPKKSNVNMDAEAPDENDEEAYLHYVLDQWENPAAFTSRLNSDQVAFANYEVLLNHRAKWLALDEDSVEVNLATAEAATALAWMSFLGKNVEQNLRDAMVYISHLRQLHPQYAIMQYLYYFIFQCIFSLNYALIMLSTREVLAVGATFTGLAVLGLIRVALKGPSQLSATASPT